MTSLRDRVLAELAADPKTAYMAVPSGYNFAFDMETITDDTAFLEAIRDGIETRQRIAEQLQSGAQDQLDEAAGLAAALAKVTGTSEQN